MKKLTAILLFTLVFVFASASMSRAAAAGDFRSHQTGNWNATATWEYYNGSAWVTPAPSTPTGTGTITIQSGHTVTVNVAVSISGVLVNSSGTITPSSTLTFTSGGQYQHNFTTTAGTIPTATWNAGSTCEIIGYTGNTKPNGLGQAFYNFTWNTPAMANAAGFGLNAALTTVNGDFTVVATGTGGPLQAVGAAYNSDYTLNIGGRLIIQGGTFTLAGASYKNYTLNVGGDLAVSGGTFNLALDQQTVGSTTYTASGNRTLNLGGSYNQTGGTFKCDYLQSRGGSRVMHFQGPGNSFTQSAGTLATANMDLFVDSGASLTLNNGISVSKSFTVSSGGTLNCGANVVSGAGTFTLSSGATLGIGSTVGISSSGSSGNIQTTTPSYNSAATYAYNGTAPQVTGAGLPSAVAGLSINNSAGVTLSATTTVNGALTLASGQLLTGAYQLNLSATGSVAGGGAGSYVNGLMQQTLNAAAGQSLILPIGDATEYAPVTLTNWTVTTAGSLSAKTTAGDHPSVSSSGLDPSRNVNRYWTLTPGGGLAASGNVTFNYPATDVDSGASPAQFIVRRFSGGTWSTTTGSGTPTTTATTVAGLGAFGDFAIGNQLIHHYVVSAPASQAKGLGFTVAVAAQDVLNQPVAGDSSTAVTMASTGSVQFDGNGDGTFGDNVKILSAGAFTIIAKDPAAESVTVSAMDANGKTGVSSPILVYDGGKGTQTISFSVLPNKNYGDAPFTVSASASSGLSVTFSIVSGPASVNGNLVTITGAGLVTVRASQAGDQNWNPATDVQQSFTVAKAPLSVTADNQSRPYGAANPALTGTIAGILNGDAITASYSTAAAAGSPAGAYDIVPALSGPLSNYNITTNKGSLTVTPAPLTVQADNKSRTYRTANPAFTFTCTGFVNGETAAVLAGSPSLSTTADTNSPVGSYPIVVSQGTLSDPNYGFTFANGTLTVTATNAVLYSDDFERATYPGDITPWVALQGAWLTTNANFQGTSDATNYSFAYLVANWTNYSVQAQVQFSASNAYGGGLSGRLDPTAGTRYAAWIYPEQSPAGPALLRVIKFRDWTTWSSTPMALVSLPSVGTNWHTLTLAFQGNQITVSFDGAQVANVNDAGFDSRPAYSSGGVSADTYTSSSNSFIMSIDNAQVTALTTVLLPLTVTANNASRAYGAANPPFTGTIVGLQPGDNITATYSTTATANSPAGSYQIVPTLSDPSNKLGNYIVTTNFGTLTVTQAVLTITADPKSKTYGNTDPALTYQLTSGALVPGDSFTGSLTRAAGENVGTHAILQGALSAGANYNLTFVGANLTIGQKAITVTADAKSKVYGDADPALTYQLTSGALVPGDSFTGSLTRAAGENVGTVAILQGTLSAGVNYNLTFVGANLTIGQKAITVTADSKSKVYGDADPALTYQLTSGALVPGDSFTGSLTRAAGENVGTVAILQGTLSAGANYNLTFVGANLTIGQKAITVAADPKSEVYGDTDPALTYQLTSGALVSGDSFTGSLTRAAGENVGTYDILQGTLSAGANYNLTFAGASLTIGQKAITVTADPKSKVYGDADPALTYQLTGGALVSGDSFTGSLTRAAGEDVGTHAILQGTMSAGANYNLTFVGANFTISPASSATTVASSMNPSTQGSNVTFTASVTPLAPAITTPTGNVQFYTNGVPLGDLVPLISGAASISVAALAPGSNTVTVAYAGDGNFDGSSNSLVQVVNVIAQTPSALGVAANGDGTITVTFQGTPGAKYLVQAVSDLGQSAGWENVSTNTAGPDGQWTFTESMAAHAQRYYRSATP